MKQSKTTLKELTHRYRAVLLKCALLNLAAFAVAMPAKAEDYPFKGDLTIDSDTQLSEEALYGNITITGGNVSISDNKEIAVVNTFSASGETTKLTISKGAGVYSQKNISLSDKVKVFLERGNSTGNDGWLEAKDSFSANNAQIDINYGDFGASRSDETQSAHTTTTIIDSTVNILGGYGWMYAEDISVSGNSTINVSDGAELVVTKAIGTCPDDKCTELKDALSYEETGTIDLKDSAAINLSGTMTGNIAATGGTLAFNSANARLNGAISGAVDIKFNDDFTLSKSTIPGRIHDLSDVAVADGKHLTVRLETFGKNLPDDDLNMKSFVMGKNAKLTLTGNASLEAEDLDIEASDKVYLTGQINVNNAGVKLGNIATANVSSTGTYAIENATLSTTGNLTEFASRSNEDMVVKNSILNFGSQYTSFAKDGGTSGDVVLEATKVTTSGGLYLENEIGGNIRLTNGSIISLNASDNLIIGNEENHSGKGSIIADNSSLVLNGTKVFVGQEADDALKLQNKASMTANGTVSVKTIDGKTGLISVADSSLNIGGTLEGNVSFIGNGTLNLSGALNGDMNIANTAKYLPPRTLFQKSAER